MFEQPKVAVVLAAGYGVRFLPFSKTISKTMLPIIDEPTIVKIVDEAVQSGIERVIVVVGSNRQNIKKHFSQKTRLNWVPLKDEQKQILKKTCSYNIKFTIQKTLDGTANAILSAKKFIKNEPFVVLCADELMVSDVPVVKQLIEKYIETGACIIGAKRVPLEDACNVGVIKYRDKEKGLFILDSILEKPPIETISDTLSNVGRYVLTYDVFKFLENVAPNRDGDKALTDALVDMSASEKIYAHIFSGERYDIGNKYGYITAFFDACLEDFRYQDRFTAYAKKKLNKRKRSDDSI